MYEIFLCFVMFIRCFINQYVNKSLIVEVPFSLNGKMGTELVFSLGIVIEFKILYYVNKIILY